MPPRDPWSDIGLPAFAGELAGRRVDPTHPGDFFWAKDLHGRLGLIYQYDASVAVREPRPKLQGIEVVEPDVGDGHGRLVLMLRSIEDREIFLRLCTDIVESTRRCTDQKSILSGTIRRAWKWHSLLRGASDGRLSQEAQQGLFGELVFLLHLLDLLPAAAVVEHWRGPLDEPKDFQVGSTAIEVKARRAGRTDVRISSEQQLQLLEGQSLFLYVVTLAVGTVASPSGCTLSEMVDRVRLRIESDDPSSVAAFDALLCAVGFFSEHDYTDAIWTLLDEDAYQVGESFPRIDGGRIPAAVMNVSYSVDLESCREFLSTFESLKSFIRGSVE